MSWWEGQGWAGLSASPRSQQCTSQPASAVRWSNSLLSASRVDVTMACPAFATLHTGAKMPLLGYGTWQVRRCLYTKSRIGNLSHLVGRLHLSHHQPGPGQTRLYQSSATSGDKAMACPQYATLHNGAKMPQLGYGTWQVRCTLVFYICLITKAVVVLSQITIDFT